MLKTLTALLVTLPVAAQAFSQCKLTDIGGPGAQIAEEGSNPVVSGKWAYAGFAQDSRIVILVASHEGGKQRPLQIIFNQPGNTSNVRLAASGTYLYVIWQQNEKGDAHVWFSANSKSGKPKAWSAPKDLGVTHHALQQIYAEGNNVHIAYIQADKQAAEFRSSDNGHTFTPSGGLGQSDGEIVVASQGQNVYLAWEVGRNTPLPVLEFAVSHDGGVHFSETEISNNGVRHAHEPIMTIGPGGRLSMVWREDTPMQGSYLQSNDHGDTWSNPLVIDQASRQYMVQDDGKRVYVTYLKEYQISGTPDWQVQIATSTDGGKSFPDIRNLSGPTGISKIVNDNSRPIPWAQDGKLSITGMMVDGARIWSGDHGQIDSDPVYLGPGLLASAGKQVALWQQPEGVVTFAYCSGK